MTEATAPATEAKKPNQLDIQPVDLNITEHQVPVRVVTGEDDEGNERCEIFYHRFAKQDRGDVINLLASQSVERSGKQSGARSKVVYGGRDAVRRFWGKYNTGVKGYPGASDWRPVPEEGRENWHPSHQVLAVSSLLECEARVVGSELTFEGGIWTLAVAVPNFRKPSVYLKLQVNEWGEKQANDIEDKGWSRFNITGGGQEFGVNVALYIETLLGLTRRLDGCHVDGVGWDQYVTDEASKQRLLKMVYPPWAYQAAVTLFTHWGSQRKD